MQAKVRFILIEELTGAEPSIHGNLNLNEIFQISGKRLQTSIRMK